MNAIGIVSPVALRTLLLRVTAAALVAAATTAHSVDAPGAADAGSPTATADDPIHYLQFVEDFAATCVSRNGVQILVRNTHPTRTVRVWLDRVHMGVGTGDRSRSDLAPGAEPEPLGCSRTLSGTQEWRPARALFVD